MLTSRQKDCGMYFLNVECKYLYGIEINVLHSRDIDLLAILWNNKSLE